MFCSKCGSQVADSAAFCPSCGQSISGPAAPRGIPIAPGGFTREPAITPAAPAIAPAPSAAYAPAAATQPLRYAGFWLRFVAWLIDYIIIEIVFSFISLPIMASSGLRGWMVRPPQTPEELAAFFSSFGKILVLGLIFQWLYFALLESSSWQATIGTKTLGLEVTESVWTENFVRTSERTILRQNHFRHDFYGRVHHGGIHREKAGAA